MNQKILEQAQGLLSKGSEISSLKTLQEDLILKIHNLQEAVMAVEHRNGVLTASLHNEEHTRRNFSHTVDNSP